MSSREGSRDREMVRHGHSYSESSGRSFIPMWDSSDPERAPPPLPLNPGSPAATTKPSTSANIAAAAQVLAEKARESNGPSPYTSNTSPQKSPERSLIKGAQHKRLQSLQTGNVRDLRSYLDGFKAQERSPDRSPTRSGTPSPVKDTEQEGYFSSSPERSPSRVETPTPTGRDLLKDTPSLRPTTRSATRSILGENTPPSSATMLALQNMPARDDTPLPNITNNSAKSYNADSLSSQILSLTSIATGLQKEMTQLSRRSRDNATDLISLKEATNARDEDIRKSLRDLVTNINSRPSSNFNLSNHFLDAKAHSTPPSGTKSISLPRIPSFNSFNDDRIGSPSPYSVEGAASVAMLEKIIREMVTKEGQERLLSTLSEMQEKTTKENVDTVRKVEQLADFIKEKSSSNALIARANGGHGGDSGGQGQPSLENPQANSLAKYESMNGKPYSSPKAADFVSNEMLKLLKKIKDSTAESGGMTSEVKALVRELRGEVLGMGRELGRKLDQVELSRSETSTMGNDASKDEVNRIIREGLSELKGHMDRVIHEKRRESGSSFASRQAVNNEEVYQVVRHALAEHREADEVRALVPTSTAEKEEIIDAVKQACEEFKPDITMEYNGLQNEEILQVLREGLEEYQGSRAGSYSISREEVMDAVQEAMQHFTPPAPPTEISEIKEEVLAAIRESLDDIKSPPAALPRDMELSRETVVDAVKECLLTHGPTAPREIEISQDVLHAAIKAGLDDTPYGEQVLHQLHELVNGMREEFQEYSAANGRDTEQVLDAVKDGLESLRAEIESYVDRAQDVTGKDEIVDTVRGGLEQLRVDVQGYCAQGPTGSNALNRFELLDYIKAEFEHLHETIASRDGPISTTSASGDKAEILAALNEGLAGIKASAGSRGLDEDSQDEMMDAMKDEFEQLRETVLSGTAAQKDEVVELISEKLSGLHGRLEGGSIVSRDPSSEEALDLIKEEFAHLREILSGIVLQTGASSGGNESIVDALHETLDGVRTQLAGDASEASAENLGAIKEELERFRTVMDEKGSVLSDDKSAIDKDVLEAIRGEFEHLRSTIATSMVGGGNRADTEEVLDAVRLGLDDLRSHFEKKLDNPERSMSTTNEVLDALNEGFDSIRSDITKAADKPIDMTVSYEILDTLKEGLANVRAELDALKGLKTGDTLTGGEVVLADHPDSAISREMPGASEATNGLKASDLEKLEVMLAQLKIKVEAMDANMQDYSATRSTAGTGDNATREDLDPLARKEDLAEMATKSDIADLTTKVDLATTEELIRELQATVHNVAPRELGDTETLAKREDTDAIETLLRNTKAHLEEISLADPEKAVTKDHLEAVEAVVKSTNEAVEGLAAKIEGRPVSREDMDVVEVLLQDVKTAVDEVKDRMPGETEDERITKSDTDAIGVLCTTIVNKITELEVPDEGKLMSKEDFEQLNELLDEFRKSHDKFKSRYETDVAVTAKAFDDRRQEAEEVVERLRDVKSLLKDCKNELKMKAEEGGEGLTGIGVKLITIEEAVEANASVGADVKELMETINREFERAHGTIEGMRVDHEERSATALDKHEEHKDAIIAGLADKIDSIFDDLVSKFDEAQKAAEERTISMDERSTQQSEMATENRAIAEDLRLNIETLGTTVKELQTTIPETVDRLSDDSKTVYSKVDESIAKIEDTHLDAKLEHQQTREEVAKALVAIDAVQGQVTDFNPQFMESLQEVKGLLQQHYDHSQQMHEQARAATDESRAQGEDIKNMVSRFHDLPALTQAPSASPETAPVLDDKSIHEKLDKLVAASTEPQEKNDDDDQLHEKLDKLVEHATEAKEGISQLDRLDKIHEQVMATAAEVTAFVEIQSKLVSAEHDNKAREAEEAASALARRVAEREAVEASILALNTEKRTLQDTVHALKSECEGLLSQKNKLITEESSLKTALEFRREELHMMDERANDLERRILDGIMNQSRAMLLSDQSRKKKPAPTQGRDLRRIPSNASTTSAANAKSRKQPSTLDTAHSIAIKTRPPVRRGGAQIQQGNSPANRRIMSLSQISNNNPTGASSRPVTPASLAQGHGLGGLKRSHSVKTHSFRKSSWGGRRSSILETDKENDALSEESEGELERHTPLQIEDKPFKEVHEEPVPDAELESIKDTDDGSDTQTERRTSIAESGLTYGTGTDGQSYTEGITPSEDRRTSYGTSDLTYGTGSYITGSDLSDRRTSYGSTVRSTLGAQTDAGESDGGEEGQEAEAAQQGEKAQSGAQLLLENGIEVGDKAEGAVHTKGLQLFAPPSDSGLGTDLPTATVAGGSDYFRRAAEEL